MNGLLKSTLSALFIAMVVFVSAQPPGGGRRNGGGPEEMVKREKQALYKELKDLTEDQKLLLDGIYDEFAVTIRETFQELRNSGSREGMREKMEAIRSEKDELVKDVLNEEQYEVYAEISKPRRGRRGQNDNPGRGGDGE